jgi:hypothetical protein
MAMTLVDLIVFIAFSIATGAFGVMLVESALKEGEGAPQAVAVKQHRSVPERKLRNRDW